MMWNYGGSYPMFAGMMFFMMIGMAAAFIIFLMAAWRMMRAHENMADSLKEATQNLKSK